MASTANTTKKNLGKVRKNVLENVDTMNDNLITTADQLIDGALATGAKWQKLFSKAIKNSKPLLTKQINIAFDGVETFQTQLVDGNKRIKKLTGFDSIEAANKVEDVVKENTDKIISLVQTTTQKAEKAIKKAESTIKATADSAQKAAKKVESKAKTTAKRSKKTTKKSVKKAS